MPTRASACPGCGSDESTGWSPAAGYAHTMPEGRAAPHRQRRATLAIGVVAVISVIAVLAGVAGVQDWYCLGTAVAVLVAILVIDRRPVGPAVAAEPDGFQRLVALCHGDRGMAERLVAGEERRIPRLSRSALVERAIERLRDDRRR